MTKNLPKRKLTLHRETLVNLQQGSLGNVGGGIGTIVSIVISCKSACAKTCPTLAC